jgi:long-chain acyl-CoA synthetase
MSTRTASAARTTPSASGSRTPSSRAPARRGHHGAGKRAVIRTVGTTPDPVRYWNSQDTAVFADGWLRTGDIGRLDADGYLYVVDRKKDLIVRGGFNVYPRDVEKVLAAHPAVAQAAVVGRPDARLGEEVVAFVSPHPGVTVTAAELTQYARQHLAAHKYPWQITIVPAVPLTSVGKLDRKKLRTWAG